ncbi:hypothetical protein [Tunturiibacter gelidiferens]|uniref:Uncharacterized protein n=1 Tax=Tunturiibacter gelidiferens TaxID=3069689 RepID=A0AAU7YXT8_9BACT
MSEQITLPSSVVLLDHQHSLLVLVPQADGAWVLKRLRGWDTKSPTEDTLEITGDKSQGTQVSISTDLNLSRDGRYILVRINYRSGAIGPTERNRSAVVTLIDLKSFTSISQQTTTDPLIADSVWAFNENDDLITTGLDRRVTEIGPSFRTVTDHYLAAALELPTLLARDRCEYESLMKLQAGATGWTKPVIANVTDGCAVLVSRANVDSVEALPGPHTTEPLNFALGCREMDVNKELHLALADCREGKSHADGMFVTTSAHTANVLSTTTKQRVLTIPLSHNWKGVTGILASVVSGNYVVLVKQGVHIEVYRLSS